MIATASYLNDLISRYQIAGAVALVKHRGKLVIRCASGYRDAEQQLPMQLDTLFRIASMTKPITTVAALCLAEQGRIKLSDPVKRWIPEFASSEITIHHLMTQTAGLTDGVVESPLSLEENVSRIAKLPLLFSPGSNWHYGLSTEVLGRVIEIESQMLIDEALHSLVLGPASMDDTHYHVPDSKADRLAKIYAPDPSNNHRIVPLKPGPHRDGHLTYSSTYPRSVTQRFHSAGGGLVSTAVDYMRFLDSVSLRKKRHREPLLALETIEMMTSNQIGDLETTDPMYGCRYGYGFGVSDEPSEDGPAAGSYGWGGIFQTHFWVDPVNEVSAILMTQIYPSAHIPIRSSFKRAVYHDLRILSG